MADISSQIRCPEGSETMYEKCQMLKCQPRILYPAKISLKKEGKIKMFPGKQKLKEFFTSRLFIHEILKVPQAKSKWHQPVIQIHMKKQKNTGDDHYAGNWKRQYNCIFLLLSSFDWFKKQSHKTTCALLHTLHCWAINI